MESSSRRFPRETKQKKDLTSKVGEPSIVVCVVPPPRILEKTMKTQLSKVEIVKRNKKIFELRKSGKKQTEIAQQMGISAQRVGQILMGSRYKSSRKTFIKATNFVNLVSENDQTRIISAIVASDMGSDTKLNLIKKLM